MFTGFPIEALRFLEDLAHHNERAWFDAHKNDYKTLIQAPALAFIEALGQRLQSLSSTFVYDTRTNGAGSLMRVYRDTRFSKDKTPYKTNVGIIFWDRGGKRMATSCVYFHMEPTNIQLHAGFYVFPDPILAAYRQAIDETGQQVVEIAAQLEAQGYSVGTENQAKRVPTGYPADHPRAEWLKYKGLSASAPVFAPAEITTPDLVDKCAAHAQKMLPLHQWLVGLSAS